MDTGCGEVNMFWKDFNQRCYKMMTMIQQILHSFTVNILKGHITWHSKDISINSNIRSEK